MDEALPPEIWELICFGFSAKDLLRIAGVSHYLRSVIAGALEHRKTESPYYSSYEEFEKTMVLYNLIPGTNESEMLYFDCSGESYYKQVSSEQCTKWSGVTHLANTKIASFYIIFDTPDGQWCIEATLLPRKFASRVARDSHYHYRYYHRTTIFDCRKHESVLVPAPER
jgi:hypothetical protein